MRRTPVPQMVRWRDIAVPAGRSPTVRSTRMPTPLGGTLEVLRRHLLRVSGGRTSPSAGAIYPFEIWVRDSTAGCLGVVDLQRRTVLTTHEAGFGDAPEFLFVLRPWLSTRKYGTRGVAYALLDAGHALQNIQLALSAHATDDLTLSLGSSDDRAPLPIGRFELARIRGPASGAARLADESGWWLEHVAATGSVAEVGEYEELSARRLEHNWVVPKVTLPLVGSGEVASRLADQLHERRSATVFGGSLAEDVVRDMLETGRSCWRRMVAGAQFPDIRTALFSRSIDQRLFTLENLFHQAHLTGADHIVAVGVPLPGPQAPVADDVAMSILAAGMLGQCLYLVATERRIAVTGVGGFVPEPFRLTPDAWPVYCMAFGESTRPRESKNDRQAAAHAHGF